MSTDDEPHCGVHACAHQRSGIISANSVLTHRQSIQRDLVGVGHDEGTESRGLRTDAYTMLICENASPYTAEI